MYLFQSKWPQHGKNGWANQSNSRTLLRNNQKSISNNNSIPPKFESVKAIFYYRLKLIFGKLKEFQFRMNHLPVETLGTVCLHYYEQDRKFFYETQILRPKDTKFSNVVSIEFNTIHLEFLKFFEFFPITRIVEVFKMGVCFSDDLIVGTEFLSTQPFLQVWKREIVSDGLIKRIWRMREQILTQFIKFSHSYKQTCTLVLLWWKSTLLFVTFSLDNGRTGPWYLSLTFLPFWR